MIFSQEGQSMPDTELPSPAAPPLVDTAPHVSAKSQSGARYVVERCPSGGGRAVYEVLDLTRIVTHRVICRTNFADANMIRDALQHTELWRIAVGAMPDSLKQKIDIFNFRFSSGHIPLPHGDAL